MKKRIGTNLDVWPRLSARSRARRLRTVLVSLSLVVLAAGILFSPNALPGLGSKVSAAGQQQPLSPYEPAPAPKSTAKSTPKVKAVTPKITSVAKPQKGTGPGGDNETVVTTVHPVSKAVPGPYNPELSMERFRAAEAARQGRQHPALPPIPEGVPTYQPVGEIRETVPNQPLVPPAINIFKSTSLMGVPSNSSFLSVVSEPSVAQNQSNVFMTANWFAGVSTDGGTTFALRDPFTFFPNANAGFCCDQDVLYIPSHNLFVWYLQYVNDANGNIGRLAWTANPAGTWSFLDLRPEDVGAPFINSDWFDYPMLGVTTNFVYINTNVFTSGGIFRGAQAMRIALNDLVTPPGGGIPSFRLTSTAGAFYCPVQGTTGTLYFFRHISTTVLRVYSWADGSNVFPPSNDVTHANFVSSGYVCTTTNGSNMCGFEDSRLQAGWVGGGNIGVMWNAAQGNPAGGLGNFPFPYVQVLIMNEATKAVVDQSAIFNNSFAYYYPSAAPNSANEIGGTIGWAGGSTMPTLGVFISDAVAGPGVFPIQIDPVLVSTNFTTGNRWGDYSRARKNNNTGAPSGLQWVATGHTLQGGGGNGFSMPRYLRFGRAPTSSRLGDSSQSDMKALGYDSGAFIQWSTGIEVDNLGYNIYRDESGKRTRLNPELIAGSALVAGPGVTLSSGKSYAWWDGSAASRFAQYYVEEIDLKGLRKFHGPIITDRLGGAPPEKSQAATLSRLGNPDGRAAATARVERKASPPAVNPALPAVQSSITSGRAVKIAVKEEGYYRVTRAELLAAGLDPNTDPRLLQLYVDGAQQPINVTGESDGRLDAQDEAEFFGVGLNSAVTNTRTYWLVVGAQPGQRIQKLPAGGSAPVTGSFSYTVGRQDKSIYFSSLRNGEEENFFGAVISPDSVDQTLSLPHVDTASPANATLEIALQGVTFFPHDVSVLLNGAEVGQIGFSDQQMKTASLSVPQALLVEGQNVVQLAGKASANDISLVSYIRLTYRHTYVADNNALQLPVTAAQSVRIGGFSDPQVRVFDVTNPNAVQELLGTVIQQQNGYDLSVTAQGAGVRTLLAVAGNRVKQAASVTANILSDLKKVGQGADLVIITHRDFFPSLAQLKDQRQIQGYAVSLIDVVDIYDEFNHGHKSPQAIKDFLQYAKTSWKRKPRYALFVGDASLDPKNYLGTGNFDFVPSKLVDTNYMEAASDSWLADFNGDGVEELAIGRLAARDAQEVNAMVTKITLYDKSKGSDSLMHVADTPEGYDFEQAASELRSLAPPNLRIEEINRGQIGTAEARTRVINGINTGQKIVNYVGHGNTTVWRGNIFVSSDASSLDNAENTPLFVMMTCLNGYLVDVSTESLAEALMKAGAGAVAVWASAGLCEPSGQSLMNQELYRLIFNGDPVTRQPLTMGEAVMRAKTATIDQDIRRTWILFGDPTMRLR